MARIAYPDECGRSRHEPIIVVGGIVVHADRDYRRVEGALIHLVSDTIPEPDQKDFIFHANHLFQGTGYFKDREVWPREKRYSLLRRLASIIPAFHLPVVFGHIEKGPYRAEVTRVLSDLTQRAREEDADIGEHVSAVAQAEYAVEVLVRNYPRDEVCTLVCEDTDRVKRAVKDAHALLRAQERVAETPFVSFPALPLVRIIDTPHFAEKADSPLPQLADLCAFLIMRRLGRQEISQQFFEVVSPQIYCLLPVLARQWGENRSAEVHSTDRTMPNPKLGGRVVATQ